MTVYWTRLDRAEMANRVNLKADDMCFYYHIHTTQSERGSGFTEANSLIEDFKKTPELLSSRPDLVVWKKDAVTKCARLLWSFLNDRDGFFGPYEPLLVPMPTSRPRGSDCRDDRLDDACGIVAKHTP